MSAATSDIHSPVHVDAEPFGQAGVRQYFGRIVTWVCVTGMICAGGMWYRSTFWLDSLEWRGGSEELRISSIGGRLKVTGSTFERKVNNNSGWLYRGRTFQMMRDVWQESAYKTIGIEFGREPGNTSAIGGFWLRIKWYLVAGVCAVIPLVQLLLWWKRSREEAV